MGFTTQSYVRPCHARLRIWIRIPMKKNWKLFFCFWKIVYPMHYNKLHTTNNNEDEKWLFHEKYMSEKNWVTKREIWVSEMRICLFWISHRFRFAGMHLSMLCDQVSSSIFRITRIRTKLHLNRSSYVWP